MVDADAFTAALKEQGFDTESEKFNIALRKAQNPAGCEWCGSRTKLAVEGPKKTLVLACCKRKAG